jgi:Uma2 family endonuclease
MSKSNLAVAEKLYTDEEYLAFERASEEKHELIDGEIVAMAGANRNHCLIVGNVVSDFHFQLKRKYPEIYAGNMRVRMRKGRYSYPDVVVVCGEPQFADEEFDVLLNPTVIIEVLSKSTRFRDKTEKLETFLKMESVRECLLIEQDERHIEHYIKQTSKQWLLKIYEEPDESVVLESIDCEITLADIYAQIEFEKKVEK